MNDKRKLELAIYNLNTARELLEDLNFQNGLIKKEIGLFSLNMTVDSALTMLVNGLIKKFEER